MPLQHSGSKPAFKANVKTLMGDVGKSKHVGSRDQALAIAYSIKRRGRYMGGRLSRAEGGEADYDPIIPPPADIGDPVREAVFPNTRSLLRGDENPIRDLPTTPGKVPSPDYDPRYAGAAGETLPFALSGVAGLAARGAGMAARGVAAAAPAFEETPLMARGLQALPRMMADKAPPSIAGLMATVAGSEPGGAQEGAGIIVDPTPVEQKEIARIGALIAAQKVRLEKAMRQTSYRDPGKDPAVIAIQSGLGSLTGDLANVQGPNSPLGQRRAAALELQKHLLTKQGESDQSAAETKRRAELPYAEKYPGRQETMQEYMPAASGVTGLALGLLGRGKVLKPLAASTLAGGAEGGFTAAWPTLQDAEFLPAGSKGKRDAIERLYDPQYWKENVAPGMFTHAGIAAGGSFAGSKARAFMGQAGETAAKLRALTKTPEPPPVAPTPNPVAEAAPVPVPRPKAPPKEIQLPDGTVLKQYDLGKRGQQWRESAPGEKFKVISADRARELRAKHASGARMPSNVLHAPPSESQGGAIRSPMDIAYAIRRQNRADGGEVHAGPILSSVPGRTDNHPMDVAEGSYVLPADHLSSLGEGNTAAGMEVVNHMLSGISQDGGESQETKSVPINAAGGEFVIAPEVVAAIGGGDIKRGHEMLDQWVLMNRKKHIRTLSKLPGPAKS